MPTPRMDDGRITEWLIPEKWNWTQWGFCANLVWCRMEADRLRRRGRNIRIAQRRGRVAIVDTGIAQ